MTSCRLCGNKLRHSFCDLGLSPLANSYVEAAQLSRMEPFYPLHAYVCESCLLVQLEEFEAPENIFSEYAYFSSYSDSWLAHAERYAESVITRYALDRGSQIVEIASNDGYLLQYFKRRGIRVLGIEPAANVARAAEAAGIKTVTKFFGAGLARELAAADIQADLLVGNNVLAHVPDLNDFVEGLRIMLKARGILSLEFPHLLRLIEGRQFDTIYHEHFSYFSFSTAQRALALHDLSVFDVEELPTHGGSLRVYASHPDHAATRKTNRVDELLRKEREFGLGRIETYASFEASARKAKRELLRFLIETAESGKTVVGYGAPAKANTLLNYCGIRTDLVQYTVDRSPHKQGLFLPGSRIPIYAPSRIFETRPDYVLILPWNIRDEIIQALAPARSWRCSFVTPIPKVEVIA